MNTLSWFIYLAELTDSLKTVCGLSVLFGGIGLALYGIARVKGEFQAFKGVKWAVTAWIIALLLTVIAPDHRTMVMIAASELGDKVAHSEEVKGIVDPGLDLVRNWIKKEADKLAKENGTH